MQVCRRSLLVGRCGRLVSSVLLVSFRSPLLVFFVGVVAVLVGEVDYVASAASVVVPRVLVHIVAWSEITELSWDPCGVVVDRRHGCRDSVGESDGGVVVVEPVLGPVLVVFACPLLSGSRWAWGVTNMSDVAGNWEGVVSRAFAAAAAVGAVVGVVSVVATFSAAIHGGPYEILACRFRRCQGRSGSVVPPGPVWLFSGGSVGRSLPWLWFMGRVGVPSWFLWLLPRCGLPGWSWPWSFASRHEDIVHDLVAGRLVGA